MRIPDQLKLEGGFLTAFIIGAIIIAIISIFSYIGTFEYNQRKAREAIVKESEKNIIQVDSFERAIIINGKVQNVKFKVNQDKNTNTLMVSHE